MLDAVFGKEHMLGAAEADAFGSEQARILGVAGDVGVGANLQAANRIDPGHEGDQIGIVGLGVERLELAGDDAAGGAVERKPVALLEGVALDAQLLLVLVDEAIARAGHAALAHAAGDDRGVRGHAAARGENSGGHFHARDVLRGGFAADQDDDRVFAAGVLLDGFLGGEDNLSDSRAGRGRQASGEDFDLLALFDQAGNQEVVELVGLDAVNGFFLRDELFLDHVDGHANGGQAGALAVAGLQHIELAILDGELEVLHIAIVLFHLAGDVAQLLVAVGHHALEFADGQRRADAGDHIFALRVHQVLAEEDLLAGGGIAREADAGAGGFAQVAEDHGLHVDRCAQPVIDAIDAAIGLGALVHPTAEDGIAGSDQLLLGILRKVLAGLFLHQLLVLGDDLLQGFGLELVVELDLGALLDAVKDVLEALLGNIQNHVAEHLDQAAIGVIGKAGIVAELGQRFDGLVVEAQIENGVHHAGHGELGAGANADQQGIVTRAQLLALQLFQPLEGGVHLDCRLRAKARRACTRDRPRSEW